MKFYIFLFILSFSTISKANDKKDSSRRRYSLELGFHSSYFISKKVDNNFKNQSMFYPLISSLGLGYQVNQNNKVFFQANNYFNNSLGKSKKVLGDVTRIQYYLATFGYQRKFFTGRKINFYGLASFNWRYGDEFIFRKYIINHSDIINSIYNSPGIGLGIGSNYQLTKRTFINLDFSYHYFFEKSRLLTDEYPDHKPVRNLISGNLKFGILL